MPTAGEALELAAAGWAVLPLKPAGKVPTTRHGLLEATTDREVIARWWRTGVSYNIGARVPAGLVVLDFDPQNGGSVHALELAAGIALPATLTVHSGRGTGGQHRYYQRPAGALSSRRLPAGVDLKTDRGYCVMPPSLHAATGLPYRWETREPSRLPAQVIALLQPPVPRTAPAPADAGALPLRAQRLARYVAHLPEGNRNAGLYWAACRAVEDQHPPATFDQLIEAATRNGLDEDEARRTVQSARRIEVTR